MRVVRPRPAAPAAQPEAHSVAEELCAKAFRLSVIACIGAVLSAMLAIAAIAPHAAGEVRDLVTSTATASK